MRGKCHGGKADDQDQKPKRQGDFAKHAASLPDFSAKSKPLILAQDDKPQAPKGFAAVQRLTAPENVVYLTLNETLLLKRFTR